MRIHNSKIFYILTLTTVFIFSINILNKDNEKFLYENETLAVGSPIATTSNTEVLPLILDINNNSQSLQIQKTLFTPSKIVSDTFINKKNDRLDNYLINIFCTGSTGEYVKVASGSGVFLSNPDETSGIVLTNAHVARHLLDSSKKCVGRTGSPTVTTHTLSLRYIPYYWLDRNNQYIIGDPDQNSTGEFDFAIIESNRIKPLKKDTPNIYTSLVISPKLKISNYDDKSVLSNTYIYSYPAQQTLSKNIYNPLFQKKDLVSVSSVYSSPSQNIKDSLLDVVGSKYVDHGSSGGMVISQGQSNSLIGLSSILINSTEPQTVRVVTIKHVLAVLAYDLRNINNIQTDPFLIIIKDLLSKKEVEMNLVQILKNIKLTSVLEVYTRETLLKLNIIK
jgi:hypothetical protein